MAPEEDGGDDDLEAALSNGMEERLNEKIAEVQRQVDYLKRKLAKTNQSQGSGAGNIAMINYASDGSAGSLHSATKANQVDGTKKGGVSFLERQKRKKMEVADNKDFIDLKKMVEEMKEEQGKEHRDLKRLNNLLSHNQEETKTLEEWKREETKTIKKIQR